MPRAWLLLLVSLCVALSASAGCERSRHLAPQPGSGPASLRIHPTFTRVKNWAGDAKPDGVEAVVEVLDQFGEPIRGWGTLLFELDAYRRADPKYDAQRVDGPWQGELLTNEQQDARWSPALRSYTFQLGSLKVTPGQTYVLQASFESAGGASQPGGGRLFDKLILEPAGDSADDTQGVKKASGNRR